AEIDGRPVSLPLLKSNYSVTVEDSLATVTLQQTFFNPTGEAINATYLFPLNQKAAVFAMEMEVGDELIKAVIKRKEDARKTFEAAKREGKAASLLVQHRSNMFTQEVANLMPDQPIRVTLKYVQIVPKVDDAYELVIPMVVGPRYEGVLPQEVIADLGENYGTDTPDTLVEPVAADQVPGEGETNVSGWTIAKVPAYPPVIGYNAPSTIDPRRVSFDLKLKASTRLFGAYSETHQLDMTANDQDLTATFSDGLEIDNRDLVLRYELAKDTEIAAGVLSHKDERGGFLSLSIEPPKVPLEETVTPRELVFVLDTSGSMTGDPMTASKVFMRAALEGMRPTDYFRILRFSNNTSAFAARSVRATPQNAREGIRFVNGLSAGGGTEMNKAINAAFDTPQPSGTLRIVVFLTDGYIGADRQVIRTVSNRIGDARIYAFGVGRSVNRFLLEGMAKEGRGRARYVDPGETGTEAARALAANLDSPLLTDLTIDWNGLDVKEQSPAKIPDLFAGGAVHVLARYEKSGPHEIILNGLVNGKKASMPITINLAEESTITDGNSASAIPIVWARERIFDKNRDYTIGGGVDGRLKEEITTLGLRYSLQTAFTSFVAVSEKIYNQDPASANNAQVPVSKVSRVSTKAYPTLNLSGSSTPEPETLLGIVMVALMMMLRFWRRLKAQVASWLPRRSQRLRANDNFDPRLPKRLRRDAWWLE
ncbi:MAG: VIT and VWA domain-containing protein, partial [Pseudomonadota bacterium]